MAKFDVFVGREDELALIEDWAQKWAKMHLIAVQGDGGVGKTWLLKETQRRYEQSGDFWVVYWDYAERPGTGLVQIAALYNDLGITESKFLEGLSHLEQEAFDLSPADLEEKEKQLLQTSIDELNALLQDKRMIYIVDTTEFMPVSTERTDQFASQLSNALFIAAGRNIEQEKLPVFERIYGSFNVTFVKLVNFGQIESDKLFDAMDPDGTISDDLRAKLHFLTAGRPVLLSLAIEWLSQNMPLPEITERPLDELQALSGRELEALRDRFEFELVERVRRLKEPLDRAVLYLAHTSRRNDAKTLAVLLNVSLSQAQALMEQLAELSFVKYNPATGNCMLHDEMKNLINQHAWPYVDPTGDVRRRLTQQIISQYYEPQIAELAQRAQTQLASDKGPIRRAEISQIEWEQWRLETECLHYHLQLGAQEGLAYFQDRFTQAQRNHHLTRMQFLLNEMERADSVPHDMLKLSKAEKLRSEGKIEEARKTCEELAARENELSADNYIGVHNLLGVISATSNPTKAKEHYQQALERASKEGKEKLQGVILNNLGRLYHAQGLLGKAEEHYEKAIHFSREAQNDALAASATNNLAYVYRLQGRLSEADAWCQIGLAWRKKLGQERDIAYSYLTKAEIDRDQGDLESAERFSKLALRSFDKVDETRGKIMTYRSLANIHRHLEKYELAEDYLEQAILLAGQMNDEVLLASLYNAYGREQRSYALYLRASELADSDEQAFALLHKAREYLKKSLDLAQAYGNTWLITRNHLELALVYFVAQAGESEISGELDKAKQGAHRLGDSLLQGYVVEIQSQVDLRRGDYDRAASHLGQAVKLIAARSGREPKRFFDRLMERLLDLALLSEARQSLAQGVLQAITDLNSTDSLQALRIVCQQIVRGQHF